MKKMKKFVIPAIIARSQNKFEELMQRVNSNASRIQLDIMDGKFVPTQSLNFDFKIPKSKAKFEAHLMIKDPKKWIQKHNRKIHTILIHYESCKRNIGEVIKLAKSKRKNVGIAINPGTKIKEITPYLNEVSQILILTVNPGDYGSKFLPSNLKKIQQLRKLKPKLDIEVDGGIDPITIKKANKAGANLFVSGSYVIKSRDSKKALNNLRKSIKK